MHMAEQIIKKNFTSLCLMSEIKQIHVTYLQSLMLMLIDKIIHINFICHIYCGTKKELRSFGILKKLVERITSAITHQLEC